MTHFFDLEQLFAPIAAAVQEFADFSGFRLRKCARGNRGWELVREHKEGGTVLLLLMHDESLGLGIGSVWQFRCEETDREYTHFRDMRSSDIEPETVLAILADERDAIQTVKFGYWTHIVPLRNADNVDSEE